MPDEEEREQQRAFFRAQAVAAVHLEVAGRSLEATMVDLSEAGVGLLVGRGLVPRVGEDLVVRIDCDDRVVGCRAEVRWATPTDGGRWRVGAQLLGLTGADEQAVRRRVLRAQMRRT